MIYANYFVVNKVIIINNCSYYMYDRRVICLEILNFKSKALGSLGRRRSKETWDTLRTTRSWEIVDNYSTKERYSVTQQGVRFCSKICTYFHADKLPRKSTRASGEVDEDQTKTRIFLSEKNRIVRKLQRSNLREKETEREEKLGGAHRGWEITKRMKGEKV